MPCWNKITTGVELNAANLDVLSAAFDSLGWIVQRQDNGLIAYKGENITYSTLEFRYLDGHTEFRSREAIQNKADLLNQIKRAYSKETIKIATSKFGWKVQQDRKNKNKLFATRRAWR